MLRTAKLTMVRFPDVDQRETTGPAWAWLIRHLSILTKPYTLVTSLL